MEFMSLYRCKSFVDSILLVHLDGHAFWASLQHVRSLHNWSQKCALLFSASRTSYVTSIFYLGFDVQCHIDDQDNTPPTHALATNSRANSPCVEARNRCTMACTSDCNLISVHPHISIVPFTLSYSQAGLINCTASLLMHYMYSNV